MLLHETTRRLLFRASFFIVCIVPTVGVSGWAIYQRQPGRTREAALLLEQLTGLSVRLDGASRPRPGVLRLSELELTDPESGRTVARCRRLEVHRHLKFMELRLDEPAIEAEHLAELWRGVERQMRRRLAPGVYWQLKCNSVVVRSPSGSMRLYPALNGSVQPPVNASFGGLRYEQDRALAWVAFHASAHRRDPAVVTISRQRDDDQATMEYRVASESLPLPAWLLADVAPPAGWVSRNTEFQGKLRAVERPDGWHISLRQATLRGADLYRLLGPGPLLPGGPQLTLAVEHAELRAGRIETAAGKLTAGPGRIDSRTLARVAKTLGLRLGRGVSQFPGVVAYDEFNCSFRLDAGGLAIAGECGRPGSGVLLASYYPQAALLFSGTEKQQPVLALVRLFETQAAVDQVPAGRAAEWLLPRLPRPPESRLASEALIEPAKSQSDWRR